MGKKQAADESAKKFHDMTDKSWFVETDGRRVIVGDSAAKIMANEGQALEVKDMLYGDPLNTWRIVRTADDGLYLLKISRELR